MGLDAGNSSARTGPEASRPPARPGRPAASNLARAATRAPGLTGRPAPRRGIGAGAPANAGKLGVALKESAAPTDNVCVTIRARTSVPDSVPLSDVFSALSFALDLTEGQPMGHALRTCLVVAWSSASAWGCRCSCAATCTTPRCSRTWAARATRRRCSRSSATTTGRPRARACAWTGRTTSAPRSSPWRTRRPAPRGSSAPRASRGSRAAARASRRALVEMRCDRGAEIVRQLGLGPGAAEAVRALDEHWDGRGHPRGLRGDEIPIVARVLTLAQTLEVFVVRDGVEAGLDLVRCRAGRWFDPLVASACAGARRPARAAGAGSRRASCSTRVVDAEPGDAALLAGPRAMDRDRPGLRRDRGRQVAVHGRALACARPSSR